MNTKNTNQNNFANDKQKPLDQKTQKQTNIDKDQNLNRKGNNSSTTKH